MAKQEVKNPYLADLLTHQTATAAAESRLKAIQNAIAEQGTTLAGCSPQPDNTPAMKSRLEELLAEKVLGVDVSAEQAALEDELGKALAAQREHSEKSEPIARETRQTLAGLQRKLTEAQEDLHRLSIGGVEKMQGFLRSEAERIGAEYLAIGKDLAKKHAQLLALDTLIKRYGGSGLSNNYTVPAALSIPLFALESHNGFDHHNSRGFLAESKFATAAETMICAVAAETERLEALSVRL